MRHFHEQLHELLQKTAKMGALAESMIKLAVQTLVERDETLAAEVYADEAEVNTLQVEVDELAVTLTSLQQPVAGDARFLFMASRIGGELERIGDQTVNIVQNTHHVLTDGPRGAGLPWSGIGEIAAMAEAAQKMVRESLTAMIHRDVDLANKVLEQDNTVDLYRDRVFRLMLETMRTDPATVGRGMSLILIARNLERIGDHATNIGEEVIYWIQGRDVRHGKGLVENGSGQ